MSDLQFRSRTHPQNRLSDDLGSSPAGVWLIVTGIALAIIVLAMVMGTAPDGGSAGTGAGTGAGTADPAVIPAIPAE